jgi:hypothetical protein
MGRLALAAIARLVLEFGLRYFGATCSRTTLCVALVVTEIVEEGLQGRPGDLELGRREGEPVGLPVRADPTRSA